MAKFCTNCGKEIAEGNAVCTECGTPVEGSVVTAQPTVATNNVANKSSNGLAIAGFVTSLVSTFLCCGSFSVIALILSIVGAVKAKDYGGSGKGMAIAGIIISAIGIIILIALSVLGVFAEALEETSYGY